MARLSFTCFLFALLVVFAATATAAAIECKIPRKEATDQEQVCPWPNAGFCIVLNLVYDSAPTGVEIAAGAFTTQTSTH